MTRPRKQNVDYFPHSCIHGKTLFVLETQFGNDGYAFWFKLLETLGAADGHSYNYSDPSARLFLTSKTRVSEVTAVSILNLLSDMGAIDAELWKEGIIWSQNFVDGVADAYRNRKADTPLRPTLFHKEPDILRQKPHDEGTPVVIYPQTKLNKTKLNKTKLNKNTTTPDGDDFFVLPDWIPIETWKSYLVVRKKKKAADTPYALKLVIAELLKIKETYKQDPIEVLNKSITSGWTDVYPLNGNNQRPAPSREPPPPFIVSCPACKARITQSDRVEDGCVNCKYGKQEQISGA